jgi:hypothetical protein
VISTVGGDSGPPAAAATMTRTQNLWTVELPTTRRKIGIITLKNRTLSPSAQLFIEVARELAKPLAEIKW